MILPFTSVYGNNRNCEYQSYGIVGAKTVGWWIHVEGGWVINELRPYTAASLYCRYSDL